MRFGPAIAAAIVAFEGQLPLLRSDSFTEIARNPCSAVLLRWESTRRRLATELGIITGTGEFYGDISDDYRRMAMVRDADGR